MSKKWIYIAVNSNFPQLVKIGTSDRSDLEIRMKELSRPTGVPGKYELYGALETSQPITDTDVHDMIKAIAPEIWRGSEFFELNPESAEKFLRVLAKTTGSKYLEAEECKKRSKSKGGFVRADLAKYGVLPGDELIYVDDHSERFILNNNNGIDVRGHKNKSLSKAANILMGQPNSKEGTRGTKHFIHAKTGRVIADIIDSKNPKKSKSKKS